MTPPIVGIDLDQYRTQAKDLLRLARAAAPEALERLRKHHPEHAAVLAANHLRLADAQLVIARENNFPSWPKFKDYLLFRSAVGALDAGDIARLGTLLNEQPAVLHYRCGLGEWYESGYFASASLLNHVAGNPIRCPLPPNIVDIARLIIERGVDKKDMERTIGLLLTSRQASEAGVALPIIDLLVAAGAAFDMTDPDLLSAPLRNQAPATAEALIRRGARQDIRQAALSGRFDVVRAIITAGKTAALDDRLIPLSDNTVVAKAAVDLALIWGSMAGHADICEYLLEAGADPGAQDERQYTALHYTTHGGYLAIVEMLLARNAPLEATNAYGGTVLGQTVWSALNERRPQHLAIIERLVAAGANVGVIGGATGDTGVDGVLGVAGK